MLGGSTGLHAVNVPAACPRLLRELRRRGAALRTRLFGLFHRGLKVSLGIVGGLEAVMVLSLMLLKSLAL